MPSRKSSVKIVINKEDALIGYTTKDKANIRRYNLLRNLLGRTYASVIRRLNAIAVLNKNINPRVTSKIRADMAYLKKNRKRIGY